MSAAGERADRTVDVAHGHRRSEAASPLAPRRRRRARKRPVEGAFEPVVLLDALAALIGVDRRRADAREVEVVGRRRRGGSTRSRVTSPMISSSVRTPSSRQVLAHLFGDELEEVLDELGLAGEAFAQHGVLGRDAHRARVEVADPHHHAARHDERRGGEAELLGPEQRGHDDVATGLQLSVGLEHDPAAQSVARPGSDAPRRGPAPRACPRA